ncbi:hypothetical protein A1D22_09345 [Pasteurellaceae bacterium LFhippo2]|nr:hypothetical protein [Pasteurellaceae bacterium LFhippo2]
MSAVVEWVRKLRAELHAESSESKKAKTHTDWFRLRDRWNAYSEDHRLFVLKVANISELLPLEKYSDTQKRAIEWAIRDINTYSRFDFYIIRRLKRVWARLQRD